MHSLWVLRHHDAENVELSNEILHNICGAWNAAPWLTHRGNGTVLRGFQDTVMQRIVIQPLYISHGATFQVPNIVCNI